MNRNTGGSGFAAAFGILATALALVLLTQGPEFLTAQDPVHALTAAYGSLVYD
ncbi:MAG: hypothetical protein U1E56_03560 [Bauldia sp.]